MLLTGWQLTSYTDTAMNGLWGWEQRGGSEDQEKGSYLPFHAAWAGLGCLLQVSPLSSAFESIKNSLLHDQNKLLSFSFPQKSLVFCLPPFLCWFNFILPTWATSGSCAFWSSHCVCVQNAPCLRFFLMTKFQLLGNLYRRLTVVAARICGTTCKSQWRRVKWACNWEL